MNYLTVIATILLVSCNSVNLEKESIHTHNAIQKEAFKSDFHADLIQQSNPELKPHTEAIKASNESIRSNSSKFLDITYKLNEKVANSSKSLRNFASLIPMVLGGLCFLLGWFLTKSIRDTVMGGVLFAVGIVVHIFWYFIGWLGLIIMLGLGIFWAMIAYEQISEQKRKEELYK